MIPCHLTQNTLFVRLNSVQEVVSTCYLGKSASFGGKIDFSVDFRARLHFPCSTQIMNHESLSFSDTAICSLSGHTVVCAIGRISAICKIPVF